MDAVVRDHQDVWRFEAGERLIRGVVRKIVFRHVGHGWLSAQFNSRLPVLTPALLIIQQSLEANSLTFNWHQIGMAAVAGGGAYLIKNFLEPTKIIEKV